MLDLLAALFEKPFVPWQHFHWGFRSFLSIILVSFLCSGLVLFIAKPHHHTVSEPNVASRRRRIAEAFGALFVMGLFGGLVGYHGGNSRDGVVGDLMPAVVTLIAGIAAYLFGVSEKQPGPMLFPMLAVFVAVLFITYGMGSANRSGGQSNKSIRAFCRETFAHPDLLVDSEALTRAARIHLRTCPSQVRGILTAQEVEAALSDAELHILATDAYDKSKREP